MNEFIGKEHYFMIGAMKFSKCISVILKVYLPSASEQTTVVVYMPLGVVVA